MANSAHTCRCIGRARCLPPPSRNLQAITSLETLSSEHRQDVSHSLTLFPSTFPLYPSLPGYRSHALHSDLPSLARTLLLGSSDSHSHLLLLPEPRNPPIWQLQTLKEDFHLLLKTGSENISHSISASRE